MVKLNAMKSSKLVFAYLIGAPMAEFITLALFISIMVRFNTDLNRQSTRFHWYVALTSLHGFCLLYIIAGSFSVFAFYEAMLHQQDSAAKSKGLRISK